MKTKHKLAVARAISRIMVGGRRLLGASSRVRVSRSGILWDLDLSQGIDLAIFLFGQFEPEVAGAYRKFLPFGGTALDIGANIGAHALPMAKVAGGKGRVFAFEPTDYAFGKIKRNAELNPDIADNLHLSQTLLAKSSLESRPQAIPSSWSLAEEGGEVHPVHGGTFNSLAQADVLALDDFLGARSVDRVDFIKLDVDGYEIDVLEGASGTLRSHRPVIATELAPYIFEERGRSLEEFVSLLSRHGYRCETMSGLRIPLDGSVRSRVSKGGSINVVMMPS
jgi:FkbM family methyltransferase